MMKVIVSKHTDAFPHEGACEGCRAECVCNHCGADIRRDIGRCTNGRCSRCHSSTCGLGGATSPGHGFWRNP